MIVEARALAPRRHFGAVEIILVAERDDRVLALTEDGACDVAAGLELPVLLLTTAAARELVDSLYDVGIRSSREPRVEITGASDLNARREGERLLAAIRELRRD